MGTMLEARVTAPESRGLAEASERAEMPKHVRGRGLTRAGFGRGLHGEMAVIQVFADAIPLTTLSAECALLVRSSQWRKHFANNVVCATLPRSGAAARVAV